MMQFVASSQFYLYGKKHFTATGYEENAKKYEKPDILESSNWNDKVLLITGANSGIGLELAKYFAAKQATLYIVCRSQAKGEETRDELKKQNGNEKIHLIVADCGVETDVRRIFSQFSSIQQQQQQIQSNNNNSNEESQSKLRLDALICNAGALNHELKLTSENIEQTFATHLLFGTFLLTDLFLPVLKQTTDSRVVVVSSGGMYNTKFPTFEEATSQIGSYNGNMVYSYCKRGQVLFVERMAKLHPSIGFYSCHPGWTSTTGVDAAFGDKKSWLEPMRTAWQGCDGIAFLSVAPTSKLVSGEFYLDRQPQIKHIAGLFMTEGSYTRNSDEEITEMMKNLEMWSNAERRPKLSPSSYQSLVKILPKLKETDTPMDIMKFMGVWYVWGNIPTPFEVGSSDNVETYEYDVENETINVLFQYYPQGATEPSSFKQHGKVVRDTNTRWEISPKVFGIYLPLNLPYLVLFCSPNHDFTVIGVEDRSYLWIMARVPPDQLDENLLQKGLEIADANGYDVRKVVRVPWTGRIASQIASSSNNNNQ